MVSSLLLLVAVAVFQLGLALYVRNTLVASAAEGARLGARADAGSGEAAERTRALITRSLSDVYSGDVTAREVTTGSGVRVVEVHVTAPLPIIGLVGVGSSVSVTGRAFAERQVAAQ